MQNQPAETELDPTDPKLKLKARLAIMAALLASLVANGIAVFASRVVGPLFTDPRYFELQTKIDGDVAMVLVSQIAPFPLVIALLVRYFWPVIREVGGGTPLAQISDKAKRSILNAPVQMTLLSLLGWVLGVAGFYIMLGIGDEYTIELNFVVQGLMQIAILMGITFVICYYSVDEAVRRYLVPYVFPEGDLHQVERIQQITVKGRFQIFLFSTVFLPLLMFYRIIQVMNAKGNNVYEADISLTIHLLFVVILILGYFIMNMIAASLQGPLKSMEAAALEIRRGQFNVQVPVVTTDELGSLGRSMNTMAAGLLERERLRETFGRVVDPTVRDHLLQGELTLGGENKHVAVLFCDLAGFTELSEGSDPRTIVHMLNDFFEAMSVNIRDYGGVTNKFMGDALLAVFGAPLAINRPEQSAVNAALAMRESLAGLNRARRANGEKELGMRIGVHSGIVLAGNIGSHERLEYTVIGDTVNTASRLQTAGKVLKSDLVISDSCKQNISQQTRSLGRIKVKGKTEALAVYTIDS